MNTIPMITTTAPSACRRLVTNESVAPAASPSSMPSTSSTSSSSLLVAKKAEMRDALVAVATVESCAATGSAGGHPLPMTIKRRTTEDDRVGDRNKFDALKNVSDKTKKKRARIVSSEVEACSNNADDADVADNASDGGRGGPASITLLESIVSAAASRQSSEETTRQKSSDMIDGASKGALEVLKAAHRRALAADGDDSTTACSGGSSSSASSPSAPLGNDKEGSTACINSAEEQRGAAPAAAAEGNHKSSSFAQVEAQELFYDLCSTGMLIPSSSSSQAGEFGLGLGLDERTVLELVAYLIRDVGVDVTRCRSAADDDKCSSGQQTALHRHIVLAERVGVRQDGSPQEGNKPGEQQGDDAQQRRRQRQHHPSLSLVKMLLGASDEFWSLTDSNGKTALGYVSDETWNLWFSPPPRRRRSSNAATAIVDANSKSTAGAEDKDSASKQNASTGHQQQPDRTTKSLKLTTHDMAIHITAMLETRLEAILQSQSRRRMSFLGVEGCVQRDGNGVSEDPIRTTKDALLRFVLEIAELYNPDVPYHSFDHAHHVTRSANDLLDMLVPADFYSEEECSADDDDDNDDSEDDDDNDEKAKAKGTPHPCSHDLISNLNAHLAFVFAALIHDVDHTGLANAELIREEGNELALLYGGPYQIAERNSIVVGLLVLMKPEFDALRDAMFSTPGDFCEFRDIVINLVLTTDIGCPKTRAMLNGQWKEAFGTDAARLEIKSSSSPSSSSLESSDTGTGGDPAAPTPPTLAVGAVRRHHRPSMHPHSETDRLRTVVIMCYMMCASDVLHLMEDFDTFVQWSTRCYWEFREAHRAGKGFDPDGGGGTASSSGWYEGQLGFIDGYVLPLAERLRCSGAFGDYGDEFVENIFSSRQKWKEGGKAISELLQRESAPE